MIHTAHVAESVRSVEQCSGCLPLASLAELLKNGHHRGTEKRSERSTKIKKVIEYRRRRTSGFRGSFLSKFILPKWRCAIFLV